MPPKSAETQRGRYIF